MKLLLGCLKFPPAVHLSLIKELRSCDALRQFHCMPMFSSFLPKSGKRKSSSNIYLYRSPFIFSFENFYLIHMVNCTTHKKLLSLGCKFCSLDKRHETIQLYPELLEAKLKQRNILWCTTPEKKHHNQQNGGEKKVHLSPFQYPTLSKHFQLYFRLHLLLHEAGVLEYLSRWYLLCC